MLTQINSYPHSIGEDICVIGDGPSGMDLVMMLSNVAKRVTLSRKKPKSNMEKIRPKIEQLPKIVYKYEIKRFTADGAIFMDDSHEKFTTIIYSTGD